MANYSHDRIVPFKDSALGKKQQIAEMFDKIAFRYDFLNRFLSGGIDLYWRRRAIRELRMVAPRSVLDVATGVPQPAKAERAYAAYQPAVPTTSDGFVSGLIGFVLGWILTHVISLPVRHHKKIFGPRQKPEVIEA